MKDSAKLQKQIIEKKLENILNGRRNIRRKIEGLLKEEEKLKSAAASLTLTLEKFGQSPKTSEAKVENGTSENVKLPNSEEKPFSVEMPEPNWNKF